MIVVTDDGYKIASATSVYGTLTIGAAATPLRAGVSDLAQRQRVFIHNPSQSGQTVYIGLDSSVTTSNGIPLPEAHECGIDLDPDAGLTLYGIAAGDTAVRIAEFEGLYTPPLNLYLQDENLEVFSFNRSFGLAGREHKSREKAEARAFSHGAIDLADGKIEQRHLILKGYVWGDNGSGYRSAVRALFEFLQRKGLRFYYSADWYVDVARVRSVSHTFIDGAMERAAGLEIQLLAGDPFFYFQVQEFHDESVTASPTTFTVNNPGWADLYPIITITNNADNTSLMLKNITDDNAQLTYQDAAFLNGSALVIDCREGTVKKDGANTIRWFGGSFLRLLPGDNSLEYTGANCDIGITFQRREL